MAFRKVNYTDGETIIGAKNMNDIQDAIIELESVANPIVGDASGQSISLTDAANLPFQGLTIYGKTTQRTTTGKNLFNTTLAHYIHNEDGTLSIIPKNAVQSGPTSHHTGTLPAGTYTVTLFEGQGILYIRRNTEDYTNYIRVGESKTFEYDGTSHMSLVCSDVSANVEVTYKIQLESGSASTDFEPYTGGKPSPSPDYPQELVSPGDSGSIVVSVTENGKSQSMTIATPNGLTGVPVSEGGNYTDENNQRWVCNEFDFQRGVLIQRTKKYAVDGSDDEAWRISALQEVSGATRFDITVASEPPAGRKFCLCDAYMGSEYANRYTESCWCNDESVSKSLEFRICTAYATTVEELKALLKANPVNFVYQFAKAIETPLSEEELAAYAALHTYRDNTTVSNDSSAYMELEYVMDAKKYIDEKLKDIGTGGSGSSVTISKVVLSASKWTGSASPYSQVVSIAGVTERSMVTLQPSVEQLAIFHDKDLAFVTEQEEGVVTVYAIGDKPQNDYTIQVSITEVNV